MRALIRSGGWWIPVLCLLLWAKGCPNTPPTPTQEPTTDATTKPTQEPRGVSETRPQEPQRPHKEPTPELPRESLLETRPELPPELGPDFFVIPDRTPPTKPPFSGTIFLDPDIIADKDPTTFVSLKATGKGMRRMYDRRLSAYKSFEATLFEAQFSDGLSVEVQVNPEFRQEEAEKEAKRYLPVIGQLPYALRVDVKTVWIHKGTNPFGGGNQNLLIHTGQGEQYIKQGILAETFVHEASHTSLDAKHARHPGWLIAQKQDGQFISTYARDNPTREDIAETFLMYLAIRYRSHRISKELKQTLLQTVPHRIAYFYQQKLKMQPIQ